MEMKFQFKEISAALLDWDLKELQQTHEAWKVFDWKSNIVYMTLPGGIFLSLFLSDSLCVSHASRDSLLSVFHQFVRVDVAPPGGWHGETGNRFREGGIKKPPVESSGLWPCATLCVTVCMWERGTVTPSLTACRGANRRAVSACHNSPGRNLCMLLPSHLFTDK